jgi:hypothetical protein
LGYTRSDVCSVWFNFALGVADKGKEVADGMDGVMEGLSKGEEVDREVGKSLGLVCAR